MPVILEEDDNEDVELQAFNKNAKRKRNLTPSFSGVIDEDILAQSKFHQKELPEV